MKQCDKCHEFKDDKEYKYHKTNKDHLDNACKACRRKRRLELQQNRQPDPNVTTKICYRCNQELTVDHFATNKSVKNGYDGWCRDCVKDSNLLRKYNITLAEYNHLLQEQDYKCAICGTNEPLGVSGTFVVDHDHKTKRIRGLLYNHCNTGLGKLGDTVESLLKAIEYLKNQDTNVV